MSLRGIHVASSIKGESGRLYTIDKILQDKECPLGRVYRAYDGARPVVVVKEIPQKWEGRTEIYSRASGCLHVRKILDTVPDRRIFVFDYLNNNLLDLAWNKLPAPRMRSILKAGLQGLASLHERNIAHNDVKATNFMIEIDLHAPVPKASNVELVDLEDARHLPPGTGLVNAQLGNEMWRSPEAHAMGPVQKPSDMFSFGLVCIYAMTRILPFEVDESKLEEGVNKQAEILDRHLQHFADDDGLKGLLRYLGDENPYVRVFEVLRSGFGPDHPRTPFMMWETLGVDREDSFRDLVSGLMNLDPEKRLTAQQALEHDWLKDAMAV